MPKAEHDITKSRQRALVPAGTPRAPAINPLEGVPTTGTIHLPNDFFVADPGPGAYALRLEGNCLEPELFDGDMAVVSPTAPLVAGEWVVIWRLKGKPLLKRLVIRPASFDLDVVTGEVMPAVIVEMLNPRKVMAIPMDQVKAIHAVVGTMRPEQFEPLRQPRPSDTPPSETPGRCGQSRPEPPK